jgi:hypothetical protein
MNAVDDYYFNIQPLIAGKGTARLFGQLNTKNPLPLQFAGCHPLPSGAHVIHYKNTEALQ